MQEYWNGLLCPPPGDLLNTGIELGSPELQEESLLSEPQGKNATSFLLYTVMCIVFKRKRNQLCYIDCFHKGFLKTWDNVSVHLYYLSGILWRHRWAGCFPNHCRYSCSVAQLCPTLCDPMDCSTPGFLVHHQLPELAQTHVQGVSDAIQPSHPLSSPSPPAFNLSQHHGLLHWVGSLHQVAKVELAAKMKPPLLI